MNNQTGISGRRLAILTLVTLVILFSVGMYFAPVKMLPAIFVNLPRHMLEVSVKLSVAFTLGIFLFWGMWKHILDQNWRDFRTVMALPDNNSYAIVGSALLFGVPTIILVMAGGNTIQQYLFVVLTKGAFGIAVGSLVTAIVARWFGVKTLDEYRDWLRSDNNDNYAILTASTFLFSIALAMS